VLVAANMIVGRNQYDEQVQLVITLYFYAPFSVGDEAFRNLFARACRFILVKHMMVVPHVIGP
jgi:hypothetical protein